MKRIISIILAVFLLLSASAFAEMGMAAQMSNEAVFNQAVALLQFYHQPESIQQAADIFSNLPGSYNQAVYFVTYANAMLGIQEGHYDESLNQLETLKEFNGYDDFEASLQGYGLPSCADLAVYTGARKAEAEERYYDAYELYKQADIMDALTRAIALSEYKTRPEPESVTEAIPAEPAESFTEPAKEEPSEPTAPAAQADFSDTWNSFWDSITTESKPDSTATENKSESTTEKVPDGLEYEISNGECTIIFYTGTDAEVVIPAKIEGCPVTSIGDDAFSFCESLTSITIPDGVTYIGDYAFNFCKSLTQINIPDGVTYIGDSAFSSCESLIQITIPDGVTYIGDYAFDFCKSLTQINIPDSVTSIGEDAFTFCESLTQVTIPNSVTSIGDDAFTFCESLTQVTIPNSVTSIGDDAFYSCKSLTSITIPDSVTSIGDSAFAGCISLTSVTIPDSVTYIDDYVFFFCDSLTIYCKPGSYAAQYAKENNLKYSLI